MSTTRSAIRSATGCSSPSRSGCGRLCRTATWSRASAATSSRSCNSARERDDVGRLAERLVETLSRAYEIDGHEVNIGASVGVSVAPADSDDADTLLKNADIASIAPRPTDAALTASSSRRWPPRSICAARWRRICGRRCAAGEFEIYYQPLIDIETNEIVASRRCCAGFIRRAARSRRAISSPLAEDTGLIVPIGEWVLRRGLPRGGELAGERSASRQSVARAISLALARADR